MLQKLRKFYLLSAVIIAGLSFLLSCENPFRADLGKKVDVAPPTVTVFSPSSGGFIRGVALFEGEATAYRSLKRVEYKIFANDATGQPLVDWREVRYVDTDDIKKRSWYLDLDTSNINKGNDGSVKMQFRALDSSMSGETVELVYIVKNRPSVISMTTPAEDLRNPNTTPRLVAGTDIRGQITDRKGLKPGFPQIKIWPDDLGYEPDANDNYNFSDPSDVNWGWASLYLPGVGNDEVGYDDLDGIPPGGWLNQGSYADRTKMAPVRVAQFAFRLEKFTVEPDEDNPDIRRIVYETDGNGNRVLLDPGRLYYFRIRTSDTYSYDERDPDKYQLPVAPDHPLFADNLVGHFPPLNYGETNENPFRKRSDAVRLVLISDAVPPEIVLDNSDKESQSGWNKKPHMYIDEPTVKKIAAEDPENPQRDLFRLRIKGMHPDSIAMATLRYTHDATGREGFLKWDPDTNAPNQGYFSIENELEKAKQGHRGTLLDPNDPASGTIFTFTADVNNQKDIVTGEPIFTTSSGPYILEAVVTSGSNSVNSAKYVVYMDGVGPSVSIQEIVGASSEIEQIESSVQAGLDALAVAAGGVINGSPYIVNNNIHVVVNRFDDSGIMQNINPDSSNPNDPDPITQAPGRSKASVLDLSMAKWIVEEDSADYFTKAGTAYQKLLAYRQNPTSANLEFFNTITDATTSPAMSGWVNLPKTSGKPADMRNNFKFNTRSFDGKDIWLYVIAQDTVQNLGFVMQKISVDQASDIPQVAVEALLDKNAADVNITGPNSLNVIVNNDRTLTGNIKQGFRNNVLEESQGIDLNFTDHDGINIGSGISISVFDLNGLKNAAGADLSGTLTSAEISQVLKDGNKNNWSGILTQQIMSAALYRNWDPAPNPVPDPLPVHLYDGMYRVEIRYEDDVNEKVVITTADRPGGVTQPGDTPAARAGDPNPKIYFFAVNAEPERPQIFVDSVEENQMQSDLPVTVSGRVRSRLKVQRLWLSFTPNIFDTSKGYASTHSEEITVLYTSAAHTTSIAQANWLNHEGKDADGYYIYYWKRDNVVFQPDGNNYGVDQDNRRIFLEAYDRLGNRNTYTRTVLVDTTPPVVNIEFNYGRSPDDTGKFIVNGKVPFTVTATDNNKLAEEASNRPNDPYSGVKWWVLPAASQAPNWDTAFGTSATTGTGGQFYHSQESSGGRFTAVINTTTLTNLAEYKLYVIVRDSAGNTGYAPQRESVPPAELLFRVDQSTDLPNLDTGSLNPLPGAVMGNANISISGGLASDDDGFDRTKLVTTPVVGGTTGYVQIRFPTAWNTNTGVPTAWGQWISVPGTLNPEGAIRFNFKIDELANGINNSVFNGYLSFEGEKHYQIRVTDEAVAGANDRPPGKNPDGATPGSAGYLESVSRTFPGTGLTDTYYFVMDTRPPEIFFDKFDPTSTHPNYSSRRPAYSSFDLLAADLKGTVEENNLESLSINWNDARQIIRDKTSPSTINPAGVRIYTWNINQLTPANTTAFRTKFAEAAEGLQSIILEATDTANNTTRIAWMFNKDTQGPEISVNSIRRVIKHTPIPAAGDFPNDWPSDWPHGTAWKAASNTAWVTFRTAYGVDNWPSEYAFYTGENVAAKAVKVIAALKLENEKVNASDADGTTISVIRGETGSVFIRGIFSDALSDIWLNANSRPNFYYRFHENDSSGRNLTVPPSNTGGWIQGTVEPLTGGRYNSADWIIPLNTPSFTLLDGEHTFDIKVADIAGNWAELFGLRFVVDRNDPVLTGYNAQGGNTSPLPVPEGFKVEGGGVTRPLAEAERVFSAADVSTTAATPVFLLKGFVSDNNLSEIFVVISTDNATGTPYRVESTLNIANPTTSVDVISGWSTNGPDGFLRLSATRTATPNVTEWEWTLKVTEKDIAALRGQTGTNDGTRRYITVTGTDRANRKVGPLRWNFYLDSKKPNIEFTNLEKGPTNFTVNRNGVNDITLQGVASDDTKIKEIRYSIAKWNYEVGAWRWYRTTAPVGWTLTAPPADAKTWPVIENYTTTPATAPSTVNWKLDNAKLNASGQYPGDLFAIQGQYRLDLYVTDWSLAYGANTEGNPHNTYLVNDGTFADVGGVSGRKFFVDRADPVVTWKDENITHYRNETFKFNFTASDFNTVVSPITARIKPTGGTPIDIPAASITLNPSTGEWNEANQYWFYNVTVAPPANLDFGNYTLEITAKDAAGNETTATRAFTFDNDPPELKVISPPGGIEAVTGRVVIRGNTTETSNLIKKVAFYIPDNLSAFPADPPAPPTYTRNAATDAAAGWHFNNSVSGDPWNITVNNNGTVTELIRIEPGTFTWEIRIPNTRNFNVGEGRKYIQWTTAGALNVPALTYDGKPIPNGEAVGKMTLYIVAEDEAGNLGGTGPSGLVEVKTFWLYPEGDRPVVERISNPDDAKIEAERLMNGRIRVAGMAKDNERVKWVWFRVLDSNGNPYPNLKIYSWNTETWEVATDAEVAAGGEKIIDNRTSRSLTDEGGASLGTGWYRASGGGSANVSWYTYINMEGELEPEGVGANRITIEVRAEDTTRNDLDVWESVSVKGMISRDKTKAGNVGNTVTALVVRGAPIFENEQIWTGRSDVSPNWGDISAYSLSGRASYRITVKDDSGIGAIRWTPQGGSSINLLDTNDYTKAGGTYETNFNSMNNDPPSGSGIAVKAGPKDPISTLTAAHSGRTFMIWEPGPALMTNNYVLTNAENVRYTTFTVGTIAGTINLGDARLLMQTVASAPSVIPDVAGGYYEWLVTVDVHTTILEGGKYNYNLNPPAGHNPEEAFDSFLYPLNLSATEISKATPLTTSRTSYLPLDNRPPKGSYTINTRPAGQAATIGGEAGDTGPVNGIAKVVIWFTRNKDGVPDTPVSWHEQGVREEHGRETSDWKLEPESGWLDGEEQKVTTIGAGGAITQPTITLPFIPAENVTSGGSYAIVIDRNDPSGVTTKWGQTLPMGLSSGGMGKIWYVELNSFGLVSGPVYIHYVVYDTAGNASYFKERLVVMNNAPVIRQIKLGTDIRNNSTLQSGSNAVLKTGNLPASGGGNTILDGIRTAVPLGTTDVQKGITEYISSIRTAETGAIRSVDFNARNRLLAFRVETTGKPSALKNRAFQFEYVSGAVRLEKTANNTAGTLTNIKAGRVYIIDDPGNARWGAVGAPDASAYTRGFAFMASLNGIDETTSLARGELNASATYGSVWELNSAYYTGGNRVVPNALRINDADYAIAESGIADSAEFAYRSGAFGTNRGQTIVDFTPNPTSNNPADGNSLFILKIFDGPEEDVFADFAIFSLRVNNNDVTRPSSQLFDLNPMTEGQERAQTVQRSLAPMGIGLNRTRGGLWNTDTTARTVAKPGHIEPRRATSLTSAQMGGADTLAGNTVAQPYANPAAFFTTDTVSGRVVLRGYAEDDQRIQSIDLLFEDRTGNVAAQTVRILETDTATGGNGTPASYIPATTGLVRVPTAQAGRVYYTDTIDLYQHRIEWAYIWDTETVPANLVVGDVRVRAIVYNANSAAANPDSAVKANVNTLAPTTGQAGTLNNYNSIPVNVRPYITGFMRNQSQFLHNTRSRQGWYAFSRGNTATDGEVVVVRGYNLGRANLTTNISLQGSANLTAAAATAAQVTSHGLPAPNEVFRYRAFTVTNNAAPGLVTLNVGTFQAVNNYTNGNDRPRLNAAGTAADNNGRFWVQPWNTEYSPGTDGSELWDDFTSVHIWRSDDYRPDAGTIGADQGAFPTKRANWTYMNPAMSMDPSNGALYASLNEGGSSPTIGNNTGNTMVSNNYSSWVIANNNRTNVTNVTAWVDPIVYSDIYILPSNNATPPAAATANMNAWVSQSLIGRSGTYQMWTNLGGVYVAGPGGANPQMSNGNLNQNNQYHVESTWYNASTNNTGRVANPPTTDQFSNTHIISAEVGGNTHIHTSYYDTKDGSIKYRYNLRGSVNATLGSVASVTALDTNTQQQNNTTNSNRISKQWTNLDGGFDAEDTDSTDFTNNTVRDLAGSNNTTVAANARVVNPNRTRIDAGEHNAIALTSQNYPVVAYFDATNQKLKLAVSNRVAPVLANSWTIRDNVIPTGNLSHRATGEFVSIAIDTRAGTNQNRIHIAALNSVNKQLVYITGMINVPGAAGGAFPADVLTGVTVRVVDHIGSVGRWCDISLDENGSPWIAYQDESYRGSMDGVRMAFLSAATFPKAMDDAYGDSISGWETMNVPARYRVEDARISIENFPARNFSPTGNNTVRFWRAAVAYPSPDFFRIAYYVK